MTSKKELLRNVSALEVDLQSLEVDLQSLKAQINDVTESDITLFGVDVNIQIEKAQSLIEEILCDK